MENGKTAAEAKCEYLVREDGVTGGVWQRECGQPATRVANGKLALCERHGLQVHSQVDREGRRKFRVKPIVENTTNTNEPGDQ